MNSEILKQRTKKLGVDVILLCRKLPRSDEHRIIINQIIRCSTSVGANYRAACRAKSKADFIYKLKIVEEECDECLFFLELIEELTDHLPQEHALIKTEANEILSIVITSIKTLKNRKSKIMNRYLSVTNTILA